MGILLIFSLTLSAGSDMTILETLSRTLLRPAIVTVSGMLDAVANIDGYSSDIDTSVELKLYDKNNNEIKNSSIKKNISSGH